MTEDEYRRERARLLSLYSESGGEQARQVAQELQRLREGYQASRASPRRGVVRVVERIRRAAGERDE